MNHPKEYTFSDFDDYQVAALHYALYRDWVYPFIALTEEAGEVAGKIAKHIRKEGQGAIDMLHPPEALREAIKAELGDVLWQVAACASELDISMAEIAQTNLQKLAARRAADTIIGEGDER